MTPDDGGMKQGMGMSPASDSAALVALPLDRKDRNGETRRAGVEARAPHYPEFTSSE